MLGDYIAELNASNALNYESGRFELLGVRGAVLPLKTLERVASENSGLEEAARSAGRFQGEMSIERVGREHEMGLQEYLSTVVKTGNVLGMGRINLEEFSAEKEMFRVSIDDLPEGQEGLCINFWRGAFERISEELFERAEVETKFSAGSQVILCNRE